MRPIFLVAHYTVQELIAHRFFSFVMLIGIAWYAFVYSILQLVVSGHIKILLDGSLFAFQLFSYLFILFLIVPLLDRFEHNNMFNFFIAAGINRTTILLGIVLGLTILLIIAMLIYHIIALLLLYYETDQWLFSLWPAFIMISIETWLLMQLALLCSLIFSLSFRYIVLIALYAVCYLNHTWFEMISSKTSGLKYILGLIFYYALPDLQLLDIKNAIVYGIPFASKQLWGMASYTLLFSIILLILSQSILKQKQLP